MPLPKASQLLLNIDTWLWIFAETIFPLLLPEEVLRRSGSEICQHIMRLKNVLATFALFRGSCSLPSSWNARNINFLPVGQVAKRRNL